MKRLVAVVGRNYACSLILLALIFCLSHAVQLHARLSGGPFSYNYRSLWCSRSSGVHIGQEPGERSDSHRHNGSRGFLHRAESLCQGHMR